MSLEEVQQAITSLFQDGNSAADEWLREFQKSQGAWEIADQLLRIDGSGLDPAFHLHCLFFAANTMYQKVRWDFYELGNDAAAHKQLRDSIVEHCQTYAEEERQRERGRETDTDTERHRHRETQRDRARLSHTAACGERVG
jgi:hypothetical protein